MLAAHGTKLIAHTCLSAVAALALQRKVLTYQMVLTVEEHLLVTMFPQFFRQLPGHADEVVGIPLNLLVRVVAPANVCARPISGLPAIELTLGKDMLLPDAMEFRLRIAIEQCGLPVIPYTPASFSVACELHRVLPCRVRTSPLTEGCAASSGPQLFIYPSAASLPHQ